MNNCGGWNVKMTKYEKIWDFSMKLIFLGRVARFDLIIGLILLSTSSVIVRQTCRRKLQIEG